MKGGKANGEAGLALASFKGYQHGTGLGLGWAGLR